MVRVSDRPPVHAAKAASKRAARGSVDEARLAMLRRVKEMTLDERIDLFERLSRDAAWARGAGRTSAEDSDRRERPEPAGTDPEHGGSAPPDCEG